ncbi:MAG: DNA translocase FtsK, partial [Bacillota bacterium]|nr:DNA translocase FtsK [Bacillota bacterium]
MPEVKKKGSIKPQGSKSRKTNGSAKKKRVRRYVWGLICLALSVFSALTLIRGGGFVFGTCYRAAGCLMGAGAFILPAALLMSSVLFFMKRRGKVALRVFCINTVPFILGAMFHVFRDQNAYFLTLKSIAVLSSSGRRMTGGGLISGPIAMLLRSAASAWGAFFILLALLITALLFAFRITPKMILGLIRPAFYEEYYEEEDEEEPPSMPERPLFRKAARRQIDIPLDDRQEPQSPAAPEKEPETARQRVKTPAEVLLGKTAEAKPAPAPVFPEEPAIAPVPAEPAVKEASKEEIAKNTEIVAQEITNAPAEQTKLYAYPPLSLLNVSRVTKQNVQSEIKEYSERLIDTLLSFGVEARIINITRGPSVTRYEIQVSRGTKFSRITALSDDIALSLGAVSVRIAPIPDKMAVGIEVPNQTVQTVYISDVLSSEAFSRRKSKLAFAVGRDITGNSIVGDIAQMPHLLIAGTTGSGKSVCINSLLISILYKASPQEVRLIMIDPKMIELGIYNGIPHLLIPVVTDPKKAAGALNWAVTEMMRRYKLFSELNVRDLASYNDAAGKQPPAEDGSRREPLPQIVIVIDELADLMFVAAHDVENAVCRIAQMARAAGMHLVIATQRPSADVITGIMKANIPSRIAFAVASQIESRIILDTMGAEKLIGKGDMLYSPLGLGKPLRVQGCFITSQEIESVIEYI